MFELIRINVIRSTFSVGILLLLSFWCIYSVSCTEIRVITWSAETLHGINFSLPSIIECHSKQPDDEEVTWYKDDEMIVKKKHASAGADLLNLTDIMRNASYSTNFGNALKMQGCYWCKTDNMDETEVTKYLFRIPGIHTFAGRIVATHDRLEDNKELSFEEGLSMKKVSYEKDIQEVLFSFLPVPNAHVTNITAVATGLEVRFHLYVGEKNRGQHFSREAELLDDQLVLEQVMDAFHEEEEDIHKNDDATRDWVKRKGIEQMAVRSTLGCYENTYMVPASSSENTASGTDVISGKECSDNSSVVPECSGDINNGFLWQDPSGRCNIFPRKRVRPDAIPHFLNSKYAEICRGVPRPLYIEKLLYFTGTSKMLTNMNILTELSETYDLNSEEMDAVISVIDHLFTKDRSKLEKIIRFSNFTNRLLRIIDNIVTTASRWEDGALISKNHIVLSVQTVKNGTEVDSMPKETVVTYFVLPTDVPTSYQNDVVFFEDWLLFPNPKEVLTWRNYDALPAPVISIKVDGATAWNSTNPLQIYFRNKYGDEIKDPVCVHFDPQMKKGTGSWSTGACKYVGLTNGYFSCICHDYSIFSIVLPVRPGYTIPDVKTPEVKVPDSKKNSGSGVRDLWWVIPLAILSLVIRTLLLRWCRSLWSGERRGRHDEPLVI